MDINLVEKLMEYWKNERDNADGEYKIYARGRFESLYDIHQILMAESKIK